MNQFNMNQIHSADEAALAFQNACVMMGDYRNHKEGESIIQSIANTPYAEEVFKICIQFSEQSYCVFYASKLWGILIMKKWDSLNPLQQQEYINYFYSIIFCEGKSISDFGYSELELVLAMMLKRMWKDNPKQVSDDFFSRINIPTWRTMKLMESLLLTMKNNHSSDYSLDKQTHAMCLQAFYETSALQASQWIVNTFQQLASTFTQNCTQKQQEMVELSLSLFNEILSFPWPHSSNSQSYKSGISSELLDPGVAFESIFVQESIIQLLEKLYFIHRYTSSLPQAVITVITSLGSLAPTSFTSTRTHSQHLHRIVAFGQSIILRMNGLEYQQQGLPITVDIIETDAKDKLRGVLLLKSILCSPASFVMVYHASWNTVTQNMLQILTILYNDLTHVIETPELIEDCVDLMRDYEEVISTVMDILSYWCDSPELKNTLQSLPREVYSLSLSSRLNLSRLVLHYSEESNESVWKELEEKDQNEDEWTVEEEQDQIGHIGRVFPGETCNILSQVFSSLVEKLSQPLNEAEFSVYQEQLYWTLVYIRHFISDYDTDEVPIAFEEMEGNANYPLLQFMDICNQYIIQVLSIPSLTVSSIVLQSILSYLKRFTLLYLQYRPLLSQDLFTIIAIALSREDDDNNLPYKTTIDLLDCILTQTMINHIGNVNEDVWNQLFQSFVCFITGQSNSSALRALSDMPAKYWKTFTTAMVNGMTACENEMIQQQITILFEEVLNQFHLILNQDVNTLVSTYHGLYRVQALCSVLRGLCLLNSLPSSCFSSMAQVTSLIPSLYKAIHLHDDLCLLVLKLALDYTQVILHLSSDVAEQYCLSLFNVSKSFCETLPSDATSIKKNSDFYVKCFSLIFRCISGVVQNNPSSQQLSLDIQLVTLYTSLLPYLSHFTFFPLLMKTVFETSLLVCNQHVRGFEEISYYALNEFFSFMISAFDRFDCEFKSMECLYLVYYFYLENQSHPFHSDSGIISFLQNNPNITENVFIASFKQVFIPKTGVVTKDGFDSRASNLLLVLIATATQPIRVYLEQLYATLLSQEPNLLQGIFNPTSIQGFRDRQTRWSYNRSFYIFYRTIQQYSE